MTATYKNFNEVNLEDNTEAFDALIKSGIKEVAFDPEEFVKVRQLLLDSNLRQGEKGAFSIGLYKEMLEHIDDYRRNDPLSDE